MAEGVALDRLAGRLALADGPHPEPVERTYRRDSTSSPEQVLEQLADRLVDYRAAVHHERPSTIAARIAELVGSGRYVVPAGLDPAWLPEDTADLVRVTEPPVGGTELDDVPLGATPLDVTQLDAASAVVTGSTVACSETGTIFLSGRPDEGRRAISLVPDHHVCVVRVDTVVELIPEALARLEPRAPITMISGPSATSDIELERVEGVHGPRRLDVILLATED